MGSGVSVHKNPYSDSSMKVRSSSNSKEKPLKNDYPVAQFGGKEETFFDSQAWLESDCEDDFVSVNGDFTPSRGSTPSRRFSFTESPRLSKSNFMDRTLDLKTETSPTDAKKKLSDLLRESIGGDEDIFSQNKPNGNQEAKPTNLVALPKSMNGSPYMSKSSSVRSSERTPNRHSRSEKEKLGKTSQCCLPRLVSSLSFSERRKRLSPGLNGGG